MTKEIDKVFDDPRDFVCETCGSTDGYWILSRSGNGVAIHCRGCGDIEKRFRSWMEELKFLQSLPTTTNSEVN